MTPIEASALFTTLVGLICNWKQERASQASDRYQDFMAWLVQHNFNELNERIYQSDELKRDLSALLSQDLSVISSKLDTIVGSLSAVADKIDSLSQISRTLGADTEALSEQAIAIIKIFDQSSATRMIYYKATHEFTFIPSRKILKVAEKRFIQDDLTGLQTFGYIQFIEFTDRGSKKYAITRQGSAFAQQLPEISI